MPNRIFTVARPVIFAHRGASAHAPENTLAAFRLAVEHRADAIELDAKLTADGKVVVIHDQTVDRTTGERGVVRKMTLAQLKALDAGSFFDSTFARERIPTLEEVFVAVGGHLLINVEITNYASISDALPDKIIDLITRYRMEDRIIVSSFHPLNLMRIHNQMPKIPVAILALPGKGGRLARGWLGRLFSPKFIHPHYQDISSSMVRAEHRRGRLINAWTVNESEDMRRLFKLEIDGIITDDPRLARRVLEER